MGGRKEERKFSTGVSPNTPYFVRFEILIMASNFNFWDVRP
jgi:hypothetical protein